MKPVKRSQHGRFLAEGWCLLALCMVTTTEGAGPVWSSPPRQPSALAQSASGSPSDQTSAPSSSSWNIQVQAPPSAVEVGATVQVVYSIAHGAESRVEPPSLESLKIPGWEVVDRALVPAPQTQESQGPLSNHTLLCLRVRCWSVGEQTLGAFGVELHTPDGAERQTVPSFSVRVDPLAALPGDKPGEVRTLKEPQPPTWPWGSLALLGAIAGAALWVVFFVVGRLLIWRRRRRNQPLPPRELALVALQVLAGAGYEQQGRLEEFYLQLTGIVRSFVAASLGVAALEATSGELAELLKNRGVPSELVVRLHALLAHGDRVKFARFKPSAEEARTRLVEARELVEALAFWRSSEVQPSRGMPSSEGRAPMQPGATTLAVDEAVPGPMTAPTGERRG